MARSYARILTSIWDDPEWRELDRDAQWAYEMLLSQRDLSACGVLNYIPHRLQHYATNTTPGDIERFVAVLNRTKFVVLDSETFELAIRTFLRHDGIISMPNSLKAAARAWRAIHSPVIRRVVSEALPPVLASVWPDQLLSMDAKTIGTLLNAIREPINEPIEDGAGFGFGSRVKDSELSTGEELGMSGGLGELRKVRTELESRHP